MNEPTAMEAPSEMPPTIPPTPVEAPSTGRKTKPPKASKRGAQPPEDTESPDGDLTPTRKRRRISHADSERMPALRLNHTVGRPHSGPKPTVVYDTERAPRRLRLVRLVAALGLLTVAWGATLLVVALSESLVNAFPHQPSLTLRFGLYVMGALGILWLGIMALSLIVVGALSLALALTRRGW